MKTLSKNICQVLSHVLFPYANTSVFWNPPAILFIYLFRKTMKVKIIGDEYDQSKIFIVYFYIALSYHTALYIKKR